MSGKIIATWRRATVLLASTALASAKAQAAPALLGRRLRRLLR